MMAIFVAGTGTDVGKTMFSSLVMARYGATLNLRYFKPVQTGADSDRKTVARLSGLGDEHFISEQHSFALAASPHFAAESEARAIDTDKLCANIKTYAGARVLIELAGGPMVPLSRYFTNLDLMRAVGFPAVLVSATGLGTINHTVLAANALKTAGVECRGVFFIGPDNPLLADNVRTIAEMTGAPNLGLFLLPNRMLSPAEFQSAAAGFDAEGKVRQVLG